MTTMFEDNKKLIIRKQKKQIHRVKGKKCPKEKYTLKAERKCNPRSKNIFGLFLYMRIKPGRLNISAGLPRP